MGTVCSSNEVWLKKTKKTKTKRFSETETETFHPYLWSSEMSLANTYFGMGCLSQTDALGHLSLKQVASSIISPLSEPSSLCLSLVNSHISYLAIP